MERQGYDNSGNSNFSGDFISLGSESDSRQERPFNQRWSGRGRAPQMQRISGTQQSHKSFMERDSAPQSDYQRNYSGYNNTFRGGSRPNDAHQMRRGGPYRRGFGQRGGWNQSWQRQQGLSSSGPDISSYYHPSMMEDPWRELEDLFKGPQNPTSNSSPGESMKDAESEGVCENQDLDDSSDGGKSD